MSGSRGSLRFRRADRLRSSKDFRRLNRDGRRVATRTLVLLAAPSRGAKQRLGMTVSRRVGSAVVRNATKRRIREYFRNNRDSFPRGNDVVVIARPSLVREGIALNRELDTALGQLAVWRANP